MLICAFSGVLSVRTEWRILISGSIDRRHALFGVPPLSVMPENDADMEVVDDGGGCLGRYVDL